MKLRGIGHLEVGSGLGPAALHLGPALGRLCQHYPDLRITVEVNDFIKLTQLLQSGQIELFLAETSEVELLPDFLVTPLRELKAFFVCRRGHPLLSRFFFLTLRDVLDYPLVMTKLPRRTLDSIALELGFDEQPDWIRELPLIKCDHPHISMEIVALSDAVGVILLPMIEQELIAGQFVLLPVRFPEFKTHAGIVRLKNRTPSPAVEVLVDLLLEIDEAVFKTEQDLEQKFFKTGYYITPSA